MSARTDKGPKLYIATTMRKLGDTGVHTHFNTLIAYLNERGESAEVLTSYEAPATLRRIVGLGMRAMLPFSKELAWRFRDGFYAQLLWMRMRVMLAADEPWILYAQCPASVNAAARLRRRKDQEIVLVTHFNRSQAEEMVEAGLARPHGSFYRLIQVDEERALLEADRIVYVSKYVSDHLLTRISGLAQRPSLIVPNFVAPPSAGGDEFSGDIATIGTLEPRKNQSFLLEVLAAAKRKGKRYTLTLFGSGRPEQQWRELAQSLGIADQVTFAGYVPQASRYLRNFKVYAHASKIENMPVSLIEALACGKPVIAAKVGGIPEIVDEGVNGFFWNLNDPEQAADVLARLLDDEDLRASMSAAALASYIEKFHVSHVAPLLLDFVLNGASQPGDSGLEVLNRGNTLEARSTSEQGLLHTQELQEM
jgi:glycosyltransferase involved in cell wall biosynthesis